MARLILAVALTIVLAGCGGNGEGEPGRDGPTRDDASTVKAMLLSGAEVQRAAQPLYACLPEKVRCYTKNGRKLVAVVEAEQERFEAALADTDDKCLAEVGRLFRDSLDAYADAGRGAADGELSTFDAAISRSTKIEIRYMRKLDQCGFSQGRTGELATAIRAVNVDILRSTDEMSRCPDLACTIAAARRIEGAAQKGQRLLDDFQARLEDDAPACFRNAITVYRRAFEAVERTAVALQDDDFAIVQREGARAGRLTVRAERDLAACLESLGA